MSDGALTPPNPLLKSSPSQSSGLLYLRIAAVYRPVIVKLYLQSLILPVPSCHPLPEICMPFPPLTTWGVSIQCSLRMVQVNPSFPSELQTSRLLFLNDWPALA